METVRIEVLSEPGDNRLGFTVNEKVGPADETGTVVPDSITDPESPTLPRVMVVVPDPAA